MVEGVKTTIEVIKRTDPDLVSDMNDETIQALIDNAQLIALGDRFPKTLEIDGDILPVRDMATRYMTLHLAAMQSAIGRGVTHEKVDVIETTYDSGSRLTWLNRSPWGQAYLRLFNIYGNSGLHRYSVAQH